MKNVALSFSIFLISLGFVTAQAFNTTLLDNWNTGNTSTFYNDIWGYETPDGTEYIIAGSKSNIHFLKIDPMTNNLTEITQATPGSSSSWRDFKTYGHYVYGVADGSASEGLSIYDMSTLPTEVTFVKQIKTEFLRAHNIFIDEANKRLYVAGTQTAYTGLIVYDLTDPENPVWLGSPLLSPGYVHDLYVRDNIAYCSHGYNGFAVWNFTIATSPTPVGSIDLGAYYNHSSWITDDGNTAFFAEEIPFGRPVTVLDISDPENYDVLSYIKEPLLAPDEMDNVPHNPFVKDGFLYVSYYQDGLQVWDVRDLSNINKVAYYDTSPMNTTYSGTTRNWGAYPFFSDHKVAISDTRNGVYLVQIHSEALPLDFIDFSIKLINKKSELIWKTSGEYNMSHFEIQRSRDSKNFMSIGRHEPIDQNAGIRTYKFTDISPQQGINYYKIISIDNDSKTNSTRIKSIHNNYRSDIKIYPNPSSGVFQLSKTSDTSTDTYYMQIKDISGRINLHKAFPDMHSSDLLFDLNLTAGNYLIDLYQNDILIWSDRLMLID